MRAISENGLALIKKFEGCKLEVYLDAAKVKTCGYGHTGSDVNALSVGAAITQAQADAFLKSDVKNAESAVNKYMSIYNFNQNQFDALVSFAFNIGNINQLTANGTRSISQISTKMLEYKKAGRKVLPGLVKRREAEKTLFETADVTATVAAANTNANSTASVPTYLARQKYTLQAELKVRTGAGTNYPAKKHSQLSTDGKKHDVDGDGALDKGTVVTCKEVKTVGSDIWMRAPSGWLAAYYKGKVYIK